eukprot:CAMPEP_0197666570 /NCGR_PEP_ID=MMETSP1338-20131121/63017_1 /TAXON_ID=43686 ORGANISM="Pelagodinium beii, Strain RCC1491" /NCGR_SAMPLE_ID=MMETSP1338 /ASSEMBLY_ACC=CAM_ASM_000754 /LENGTH=58 /DNA_ID=CAMNT_0043245617 /DNA_START=34 /DNA_END=206 /DNA_ORIENTATION=-
MTNTSQSTEAVDRLLHLRAAQAVTLEDDFRNRLRARRSLGGQMKSFGAEFPDYWFYQT